MTLKQDCDALEEFILEIIEASKKHSVTDMVKGDVSVTTIQRFKYPSDKEPFAVTSTILKKIAKRLDVLEDCEYYLPTLISMIKSFINSHILVCELAVLNEKGLNYKTLRKIRDFSLDEPYRISTLIEYAEKLENNTKEGLAN